MRGHRRSQKIAVLLSFVLLFILQYVASGEDFLSELQKAQATEGLSIILSGQENGKLLDFSGKKLRKIRLLPDGFAGTEVSLSPDAGAIAFASTSGQSTGSSGLSSFLPFLVTVNPDGTSVRDFRTIVDLTNICWSLDKKYLAFLASTVNPEGKRETRGLWVLNIRDSGPILVDTQASISCPAWSPDNSQLVYSLSDNVKMYSLEKGNSRVLVMGKDATWSPDGKWVAFRRSDAYLLIDPNGQGEKSLLKDGQALTPLWWSPDSRYVAFASRVNPLASLSVEDQIDLHVRRLTDGSEKRYRLYWGPVGAVPQFQWVRSSALVTRAKSAGIDGPVR